MLCPQCKKEVEYQPEECEFCPECGAALKAENHEAAQIAQPAADFQSILNSVFSQTTDIHSAQIKSECEYKEDMQLSECPYLKVEYNRNLFFLNGSQTTLKLRLTPLSGELRKILFFMAADQGENAVKKQIPIQEILTTGRAINLTVTHQPGMQSGILPFTFRIGCKTANDIFYYQFSLEFSVFNPKDSGTAVRDIIINQQITAKDAGDVHYRDNLGDALLNITQKIPPTAHELISKLNTLPPDYVEIPLNSSDWTPEKSFINGALYVSDKLAIEWNGYKIYMISKHAVKFGRSTEKADLTVHSGGDNLGPRDYPNNTVSRLHAEVVYCENSVKFFDYSSYGTYIDGQKPDSAGIPIQDEALIEFGDIHWQMEMQHCFGRAGHYICESCPAHRVKSMTFSRKDGEKAYYLLIWECCELGKIAEALADWTVFARNGSFLLRTPDQNFYALRPGRDIVCNNQTLHITYF